MSFSEIYNWLTNNTFFAYALFGLVLIVIFASIMMFKHLRSSGPHRTIKRVIRRLGHTALRDVSLPDGVDGYVHFDFLIKMPGGLLIINFYDYEGFIFGGEKINYWTQVINHKSYKFENPLVRLTECTRVLKEACSDVLVEGVLVFSNRGEFPKGMPDGVCLLDNLSLELQKLKTLEGEGEVHTEKWPQLVNFIREKGALTG